MRLCLLTPAEPEPGCVGVLNWRSSADPRYVVRLGDALAELPGWTVRALHVPVMVVLRRNDRTEVLLVPRTGRIQIRVDHAVPEEMREVIAHSAMADIQLAADRIGLIECSPIFTPGSKQ